MARTGQVIDNKYEVLKLIGRGGMSRVYLAMDKRLNKQWAVKEIQKNARDANNEIVIQSAIAEANMIKSLDHPAIVRIVDIIDSNDVIYIIEDYIEGETLSTILEENGAQPQDTVIEWAMQICEALEYLHTRKPPIIYRDMKPANVMLKPDGNIKIIDFGIAREYKERSLADTVNLGTRGYAAPEQFGKRGQTDARTDIYCLGVTLYHLLTGKNPSEPPYEIYPIRHWNPQLSAGLETIIQKCTQVNPEDRYQSCAELLYALQHHEEYGAMYRAKQKKKLFTFIASAAATVFFAAVGVLGIGMRTQTNNADYQQNLLQAEKASTAEEKIAFYHSAIGVKPNEPEAYRGMVEALKSDAVFTVEEETELKKDINAHIAGLRAAEEYADLAFETGKLYWYYYDYGAGSNEDNTTTRMKASSEWFSDALNEDLRMISEKKYQMAKVYHDIADFHAEIQKLVIEGDDAEVYSDYWHSLTEMNRFVRSSQTETEIVLLETYRLIMNSINTYAYKFSAFIPEDEMRALFDDAKAGTDELVTTTEKTAQIRQSIIDSYDGTDRSIDRAYGGRK